MRQGVQITGVGTSSFAQSIQTITKLFSLMSRGFQENDMHAWKPDTFMTHTAVNIYNRYFYNSRDCPDQANTPLGDTIDPDHYLAGLALAAGVIHTLDNQVEYFKATPEKKSVYNLSSISCFYNDHNQHTNRLIKTNPSSFRLGDIVEALFTIVVIPVKHKKHQMMLVLRALTLLDTHHTMVSTRDNYRQRPNVLPNPQIAQSKRLNNISSSTGHTTALPLKRKACYDEDEEVQQVRKGIRNMSV